MKKNIQFLTILLVIATGLASCTDRDTFCLRGNGISEELIIDVEEFNQLTVESSIDVVVTQGSQEVRLVGDNNIIDRVRFRNKGSRLKVDLKEDCVRNFKATLFITVSDIEQIEIKGSNDVLINDFINQDDLELVIDGSGDIEANEFEGLDDLNIIIRGSGNVKFNQPISNVHSNTIDIMGSGDVRCFDVDAEKCVVFIDGSGDCSVTAQEELNVRIAGSGDVKYKGYPNISSKIFGSGRLINKN